MNIIYYFNLFSYYYHFKPWCSFIFGLFSFTLNLFFIHCLIFIIDINVVLVLFSLFIYICNQIWFLWLYAWQISFIHNWATRLRREDKLLGKRGENWIKIETSKWRKWGGVWLIRKELSGYRLSFGFFHWDAERTSPAAEFSHLPLNGGVTTAHRSTKHWCFFPAFFYRHVFACCCKLPLQPCNNIDSLPVAHQTQVSRNDLGFSSFLLNISAP